MEPNYKTVICGVISEQEGGDALRQMESCRPYIDCAELRLDYLSDLSEDQIGSIISRSPVPIIATLRPIRHGGNYNGQESMRFHLLEVAWRAGAMALDLEDDVESSVLERFAGLGIQLIISYHNFTETPTDLLRLYAELRKKTGYAVKIATMAQGFEDLLQLFSLQCLEGQKILVGMGTIGQCTRILAQRFGSLLTYATPSLGKPTAQGQFTAEDMVKLYGVGEIHPGTRLYGVLGWPITQSLSPVIHNVGFKKIGWDGVYIPLGAQNLHGLKEFGRRLGFWGFSITHPHKQEAMNFCDQFDKTAQELGVINTITVENGIWKGANTDVPGFLAPLKRRINLEGKHVLVYGSGGAAAAAVYGLVASGARVTIVGRNPLTGRKLADRFQVQYTEGELGSDSPVDIVVNTTPVGMHPKENLSPCCLSSLMNIGVCNNNVIVYDTVYNPFDTLLIRQAKELGCSVIHGIEMFVEQASAQFHLWTGRELSKDLAFQTVREALLQ